MGFMKWAFNLVTGGLLDKGLDAWGIWIKSRNDKRRLEREMYGERVRYDYLAKTLAAAQLRIEMGWWVTRWIRPAFAYPIAAYCAAHIARALYFHDWVILPLPEFLIKWAGWIVAAYFLMRPVEKIGRNALQGTKSWIGTTVEALRKKWKG